MESLIELQQNHHRILKEINYKKVCGVQFAICFTNWIQMGSLEFQ